MTEDEIRRLIDTRNRDVPREPASGILPGVFWFDLHTPGYSLRLISDGDRILIAFGSEDVVGICDRRVPIRMLEETIEAHRLKRRVESAPFEPLHSDWFWFGWPWRGHYGDRMV